MAIQSCKAGEDHLAHLGDVPEDVKAQWHLTSDPATVDENIKGCFGFFEVAELCWDISEVYDSITITLRVAGETVARWVLDKTNTCINISMRPLLVFKLEVKVCVDWGAKKLTLTGKACYWVPFSWHCKSYDVTLIHW